MTKDILTRFIFEDIPVRGLIVQLNQTWLALQERKSYPAVVKQVLGEFAAANILLSSNIKLEGSMTMQIQSNGPVSLLVMDCNHKHELRGLAHHARQIKPGSLHDIFGKGQLAITIDNKNSNERYQGIVALEGDKISQALESYLDRSEQLQTKLILAVDEQNACGMLLQKLPGELLENADDWNRLCQLADTLKPEELFELDVETVIHRLFNEDTVRLLNAESCRFQCTCSRERVSNMLISLGKHELDDIIKEQGSISIDCEFCNQNYNFDKIDVEALFVSDIVSTQSSQTRH